MNKLLKICPNKIVMVDLFALGVDAITHKSHEGNLNFSAKDLEKGLKKSEAIVHILGCN